MRTRNFFALLMLPALLALCLTTMAWGAVSDEDFMVLCYQGSAEEVHAALLKGANPNAKNNGGRTALMWAAAQNNNPDVVSVLLKAGADVNAKDKDGKTVLDLAQDLSNVEAVKVLEAAR